MADGVQLTTDFPRGLKDDLDEVHSIEWKSMEFQAEKACNSEDTEYAYEDHLQLQLPSESIIKEEGGAYQRAEIKQISVKRISVIDLGLEYCITRNMVMDNRYKQMTDGVKAITVAMHRKIERFVAEGLFNGFTSQQAADGVSVFNTSHSLSLSTGDKPTTYSNRSQLVFNPTNLKARIKALRKQRDQNGDPLLCEPTHIVFGPDIADDVEQVLGGMYEPGSADYNKTIKRVSKLQQIEVGHFIEATYPNMWILLDKKVAKPELRWRLRPTTSTAKEEKTGNYLYRIDARLSFGWVSWEGADGNTGEV